MSLMDNLLGILRVRVKRGVNLAVRDVASSDPYVVLKLGRQVLSQKKKIVRSSTTIISPTYDFSYSFAETQDSSGEEERKPTMGRRFNIHSHRPKSPAKPGKNYQFNHNLLNRTGFFQIT